MSSADELRRRVRWLAWLGFTKSDVLDHLDGRQERAAVHLALEEVAVARRRRVAALMDDNQDAWPIVPNAPDRIEDRAA